MHIEPTTVEELVAKLKEREMSGFPWHAAHDVYTVNVSRRYDLEDENGQRGRPMITVDRADLPPARGRIRTYELESLGWQGDKWLAIRQALESVDL